MVTHTITFAPAGVKLACNDETTLLDAAMAAGFFPRHSCRRGECGACEAKLVAGRVRYPEHIETARVAEQRCLTCVALPLSDVTLEAAEISATPGRPVVKTGARVTSVERASKDVSVVRLQLPPAAGFLFEPGQYLDVVLRDGTRRSYSMANKPDAEGNVELHIRAMPGGRFSQHVYQNLKPRDLLRVEGPFGTFTLSDSTAPVVLLASGTGYAPIASMMRSHQSTLASRCAVLYWGGQRQEDLYAFAEAQRWAGQSSRLRFVPVLSDSSADWDGRRGFVHQAVQQDFPDLSACEVYACGKPLMVDAARHSFIGENGLSPSCFFSDAFIAAPAATSPVT